MAESFHCPFKALRQSDHDHVKVNMFTYLPDVFPISSDFFYSWRGHWQMKIHKNQTRASCFLIAISMPSVRIRAEPQWQPFWKGHYSLVNSTSTAGIGLQYIQYMFWEHIFMWWSTAKTPLQKSICILCMFWKHIFMQWSKEREVIPLTFPTSGWLPLASVQNSPTSRAKIWCLHTLTLTISWYHRSSWYTGWIKVSFHLAI